MAVTLLEQRQIEANVLVPLIKAFQAEFGVERANAIARKVITQEDERTRTRISAVVQSRLRPHRKHES